MTQVCLWLTDANLLLSVRLSLASTSEAHLSNSCLAPLGGTLCATDLGANALSRARNHLASEAARRVCQVRREGQTWHGVAWLGAFGALSGNAALLFQEPLQDLDLFLHGRVLRQQRLDFADCVQHRGVIAAAETASDLR